MAASIIVENHTFEEVKMNTNYFMLEQEDCAMIVSHFPTGITNGWKSGNHMQVKDALSQWFPMVDSVTEWLPPLTKAS